MRTGRFVFVVSALMLAACDTSVSGDGEGGKGGGSGGGGGEATTGGAGGGGGQVDPCGDTDLAEEMLGNTDPEQGEFTLDEALAGLPEGAGPLRAIIETDLGTVTCELFPEVAPNGVANFVGLARGRRAFRDGNIWVRGRRFYDGLLFHRVIDDFMAQGGDPRGTGIGGPGYKFADEIGAEKSHVPGTIAYANSGPNSNGSQFYIVAETGATHLDGDYVIFGLCDPVSVVKTLTEVPTDVDDRPMTDLHMNRVSVTRCVP